MNEDQEDQPVRKLLHAPVIDFPMPQPPRLIPISTPAANSTGIGESSYSPFTNTLTMPNLRNNNNGTSSSSSSSRRNSLNKEEDRQTSSSKPATAQVRNSRIDSNESYKSATNSGGGSGAFIGSLTVASGEPPPSASPTVLIKEQQDGQAMSSNSSPSKPVQQTCSQSMFELNNGSGGSTNKSPAVASLAAPVGSSSRRSSQNSASANENLTNSSHNNNHSHSSSHNHGHQKTVASSTLSLPPPSSTPTPQASKPPTGSASAAVQQQNVQQLQTEISIKDELLKTQTVQLVETHRRQADLEEQLAFFKIDAKFDSVANFLLNPNSNSTYLNQKVDFSGVPLAASYSSNNNNNFINEATVRNSHSPLPPAPYIGKSPFKLVLSADPIAFRRDSSSIMDAASVRAGEEAPPEPGAFQQTAADQPLIIGLSREFANSLKQLQGEINRVSAECQSIRKNCDQFDFQRIEQSSDRLDDDIEICRSRLGKLRADVPSQLTGSLSLSALFDSLYSTLNTARNDLNTAVRQKEEALNVQSKPPLGPAVTKQLLAEPSPLFMAALADNNQAQPQPPPQIQVTPPRVESPGPHKFNRFGASNRFLQEPHRFQQSNSRRVSESEIDKNQSLAMPPSEDLDQEDLTTAETLTRQLLSRLTNSELIAVQYKTDMENLKARLDSLTPNNIHNNLEGDNSGNHVLITSTPKQQREQENLGETTTNNENKTIDVGTEMTPERNKSEENKQPPQTAIYIQTAQRTEKGDSGAADTCDHHMCSLSFDVAASAYKSHLSGLDRRLDTHENFVLNAFGTLLDRYVVSPRPNQPNPVIAEPPAPQTVQYVTAPAQVPAQALIPAPPPVPAPIVTLKARGVQVSVSDEEDSEIERQRRERARKARSSMKHAMTVSNLKSSSEEQENKANDYNKNFEQIFTQFKSDIQDIKQTFLSSVQQQQLQSAQQFSQLQHNLAAQNQQNQQRESTPIEQASNSSPPMSRRHRSTSRNRHRSSNRGGEGCGVGGDLTALSGIVQVAEETLQTLTSNRAVVTEQVSQLEMKRVSLEEDLHRLGLEGNQLQSNRDQLRETVGQFEAQIQYCSVELASKQQELSVIDELISEARRVLSDINAKTGELQSRFDLLQSTAEQHRSGLDAIVTRSTSAKSELAQLEERLAKSKTELGQVERRLSERRSELKSINESIECAKVECDLVVRQREAFLADSSYVFSEHSQLTQLLVQLNAERESLSAQIEAARENLLVLDTHSLAKQQECDQNQRLCEDFMENIAALVMRRDTLQNEVESVERRLVDLQGTLNEASEQRRSIRLEIDHLESVKSALRVEIEALKKNRTTSQSSILPPDDSTVLALERKLAEAERQLSEERSKSGQLDVVARERQDEVGRLVGQLLVVHADYLNLHRQLRRMNATFDGAELFVAPNQNHHNAAANNYPNYSNLLAGPGQFAVGQYPPLNFRESSPDLVVNSAGAVLVKGGSIERPSSSGSANSNPPNSNQGKAQNSGSQRSAESGYSSIA